MSGEVGLPTDRPSHASTVVCSGLPALPPEAARRHLHQGEMVAQGIAERIRRFVRPALLQPFPERREGERIFLDELPPDLQERFEIDAGDGGAVPAADTELCLVHGLKDRPQRQGVTRGDQVDGRAHERHAHRPAALDECGEIFGAKIAKPGPQAEIGWRRGLRLQADQMFQRSGRRHRCALEQELPRKQRAVQGTERERLPRRGSRLADAAELLCRSDHGVGLLAGSDRETRMQHATAAWLLG